MKVKSENVQLFIKGVSIDWGVPVGMLLGRKCTPENTEEYRKHFLGDFKPDRHFQKLCERLEEYYRCTPERMDNREAYLYLKDFRKWCADRCYTQEEINLAKKQIRSK